MSNHLHNKIRDAYQQIKTAEHMVKAALNTLSKTLQTVGICEDILRQHGLDNLPQSDLPVTEHRRLHRMGRAPKIDGDPELQAYILARIDRMTFNEIAQDVAKHFPETRRVGKSTIYTWYKRQQRAGT